MSNKPRIFTCEFHQETNSFNPVLWDMEKFRSGIICEGEKLVYMFSQLPSPLLGMFDAIREGGGEVIPGYAMRTQSGGKVAHAVLEHFLGKLLPMLHASLPLDGVFISLHGATQTDKESDACGRILEEVRAAAGPGAVIAVCCDMHANVTGRMTKNANFICGYQTYPHTDHYQTGYRAAKLGMRRLAGETLHAAHARLPMIVPASGYSSDSGIFKDILNEGHALVKSGELADFTVFQMQPWLDVSPASSGVMAVAKDVSAAERGALLLAERLWQSRKAFWPELMAIDKVIELAEEDAKAQTKPVLLIDAADSPNAGAAGDSAAVVERLLARGSSLPAATVICDSAAVRRAFELGVGGKGTITIGACTTPGIGEPLTCEAYVCSLHDGIFRLGGKAGHGLPLDIGRAAVVRAGSVSILLCHYAAGTGDPELYRHFGIEPLFQKLVVVKANTSFREPYAAIAGRICMADTPGAATADLRGLPFAHIPKDFYPFTDADTPASKMCEFF